MFFTFELSIEARQTLKGSNEERELSVFYWHEDVRGFILNREKLTAEQKEITSLFLCVSIH